MRNSLKYLYRIAEHDMGVITCCKRTTDVLSTERLYKNGSNDGSQNMYYGECGELSLNYLCYPILSGVLSSFTGKWVIFLDRVIALSKKKHLLLGEAFLAYVIAGINK